MFLATRSHLELRTTPGVPLSHVRGGGEGDMMMSPHPHCVSCPPSPPPTARTVFNTRVQDVLLCTTSTSLSPPPVPPPFLPAPWPSPLLLSTLI